MTSNRLTSAAALMLVACGPSDGPADRAVDAGLALSDVHVLGTSQSLAVVQDLDVLDDGSVWVLNSLEPYFVGFDAAGSVISEFGRQGGGPEEFRFPLGFVSNQVDGEAWVFDGARHSFVRISNPDAPWAEIRLPRDSIPPGTPSSGRELTDNRVRSWRLGDEILVSKGIGTLNRGVFTLWYSVWAAELLAVARAGDEARHVLSLDAVFDDPETVLGSPRDFPPFPMWMRNMDVCDDEILVFDRIANVVRGFDAEGTATRVVELPPDELDAVSERQFARAALGYVMAERTGAVGQQMSPEDSARVLNEGVALIDAPRDVLADYLPRYVDMRCGGDGTFWMKPFDADVGGLSDGYRWMRVDEEGSIETVELPPNFDPQRFTPERIWGVQRDELDLPSIAWIEIGG